MITRIKKYTKQLKKIKFNYVITSKNNESEKNFISKLIRYKIKWNAANKNVVLTQIVQDYSTCIKQAAATNYLALKNKSNIGLYSVATQLEDTIFENKFLWDKLYSEIFYKRLDRIFLSFGGKVIFRNVYQHKNKKRINEQFAQIKNKIKKKEDILNIEINGLKVGDLVYDTYLRFAHKPTIDLNDPFLDKVIFQSLHICNNLEQLFLKYNVTALVNTYTTYIHHGLIVRLCLKRNIPVYTVGAFKSIVHKAVIDFPTHQNNHQYYSGLFKKLDNKEKRLCIAKKSFESRFKGEIDTAIGYMKASSFSKYYNQELENFNGNNTVVILAHCFFDSPHIYRDLLFPDFYEWMTFTLDVLSKDPTINVLVKEHPNGIEGNELVFEELKGKYQGSNITFIHKKTSNSQLFQMRPKAIITAYGTAAAEFAYHQIPVISIYDNPFTSYNFINVSYSINQYRKALTNLDDIKPGQNKKEVIESYYMQNMFFLKGRDSNYLSFNKYRGETFSDSFLNDYMPLMNEAYFEMLDESIQDGFGLCEWEQNSIK